MDNEFAVIKVRKQELNNTNIKSYENNVRISYAYDNERNPSHICIIADSEYIWAQTLQELEWLTVSSIDGVATIRSLNSTVIILTKLGVVWVRFVTIKPRYTVKTNITNGALAFRIVMRVKKTSNIM
ncbi:unnamed protein product [Rotaria magnacalcarata]